MQPWRGFPRLSGRSTAGERDAENRLVAVTIKATGHRSEFGYDGLGRRVEIIEKDPDATQTLQVTSDKKYLWDNMEIAEERSADGATVTKRFYHQGFVDNDGTTLFYTRDHLGSIRELTDGQQNVRARYDYDPYGRMTKISGDRDSLYGYAGMEWHAASGLNFAVFRAYDPNTGRWISRDRIGEFGGVNLYAYVGGNVVNNSDPLGFCYKSNIDVILCRLRAEEEMDKILDQVKKLAEEARKRIGDLTNAIYMEEATGNTRPQYESPTGWRDPSLWKSWNMASRIRSLTNWLENYLNTLDGIRNQAMIAFLEKIKSCKKCDDCNK